MQFDRFFDDAVKFLFISAEKLRRSMNWEQCAGTGFLCRCSSNPQAAIAFLASCFSTVVNPFLVSGRIAIKT